MQVREVMKVTTEECRPTQRYSCDRRRLALVAAALFGLTLAGAALLSLQGNLRRPAEARLLANLRLAAHHKPSVNYALQPLRFEENLGQTDGQVNFLARGLGYTVFLTRQGAVLSLGSRESGFGSRKEESRQLSVVSRQLQKSTDHGLRTTDVVRLGLVGGNQAAKVAGVEELPGKANYFIGNDARQWRRNVPTFAKVKYEGVYPGVDLVYYGNPSAGGKLE